MPLTDTRDLQRLAELRCGLENLKTDLVCELIKLDATPEGQAVAQVRTDIRVLQTLIIDAEAAVREAALEHYDETQETEPWPGVTVKPSTVIRYEISEVTAWAMRQAPHLLVLDEERFVALATSEDADTPAEVSKVPHVQIARDLSEYLPGEK